MVKIVILAGLGLAGMWMLHTLAQDYDKISNRFMGISTPAKSAISKRSSDGAVPETDIPGVRKYIIHSKLETSRNIIIYLCIQYCYTTQIIVLKLGVHTKY